MGDEEEGRNEQTGQLESIRQQLAAADRHIQTTERFDRIFGQTTDVETMMTDALQSTLEVFGSDRAWLLFPCNPEAESCRVPIECTRPEYPGAFEAGSEIPMVPLIQGLMRAVLQAGEPIQFGPDAARPMEPELTAGFLIQSQIVTLVRPLVGDPWILGMHQCSHARFWDSEEQKLFKKISHSIEASLTNLVYLRELQRSEEHYRAVVENSSDYILRYDRAGRHTFANSAALEVAGMSADEFIGKTHRELGFPDDLCDLWEEKIKGVFETGQPDRAIFAWQGVDGLVTLDWRVVAELDRKGTVVTVLGVSRDITELKRGEAERIEFEKQILHTQKLESLGVMAGGIAHDFNNLLTAILSNTEVAESKLPPDSPARPEVEAIRSTTEQAADLTLQLLAYTGKGQFVIEPVDISEVVRKIIPLLEVSVTKSATIRVRLQNDLPAVRADVTQLRQIIINLATNAAESLEGSTGDVTISTDLTAAGPEDLAKLPDGENLSKEPYVSLMVSDTGCGMDSDTIDRLFEPFFTTKFSGRGLGMAAIEGIVRGHGGIIQVTSEVGKGTEVRVLLPTCGPMPQRTEPPARDVTHDRAECTILLVDDEEVVRTVASKVIRGFGFDLLTAGNGIEAVEIFQQHYAEIDVVLLDITMPGMNGLEALREIKAIDPSARILLSSGHSQSDVTTGLLTEKSIAFIQKPYRMAALKEKLLTLLAATEPSRSL